MAMPLAHFVNDVVKPTIDEFNAHPDQAHKGFSVVCVLDAFAAHIFAALEDLGECPFERLGVERPKRNADDTAFRYALSKRCSEFAVLRDVAKANKHAKLVKGNPVVNGSGDTAARSVGFGEGKFSAGRFDGTHLVVETLEGETFYLDELARTCLAFLEATGRDLGVLE